MRNETGMKPFSSFHEGMVKPPAIRRGPCRAKGRCTEATTMVDRSSLKLVGLIFASIMIAVMLTTTMVVKGYADGVYTLEKTSAEGR